MGIFGNDWKRKAQIIGATLKDVGGSLNHGPTGYLDQYQQQQQAAADKAAQGKAYDDMVAHWTGGSVLGPGGQGGPATSGQVGPVAGPSIADMAPWLLRARQAGVDISDPLHLLEAQQPKAPKPDVYQGVNLGGGVFASFDPDTNEF